MGFLAAIPALFGAADTAADAGAIASTAAFAGSAGFASDAAIAAAGSAAASSAAAATGAGTLASTLAAAAPYASLASGAIGAVGALETSSATAKTAAYQSQVASNNIQIAQNQAQQAQAAGEVQQEQQGLKTKAQVGAIEAAQGASNIDVNSGSAVDVRSSAEDLGELNALTLRSNTAQQVYGYQTLETSLQGQRSLSQFEETQAPIAGAINASSSLLSGASGAARSYAGWQLSGGGGPASVWG